MKINFSKERYSTLLEDAKRNGISIPKLISNILDNHYKDSHKGVKNNEHTIKRETD